MRIEELSNRAVSEVVHHLHRVMEHDRTRCARLLHDELGGYLMAAAMDVSFAEQGLDADEGTRERLTRVRETLAAAIDLKRHLIEDLRPSLLDNFGLIAALRWYVPEQCRRAGVTCNENYPRNEPQLRPEAATAVYRILQELLTLVIEDPTTKSVEVDVAVEADHLQVQVVQRQASEDRAASGPSVELVSIAHRVSICDGHLQVLLTPQAVTYVSQIPLASIRT